MFNKTKLTGVFGVALTAFLLAQPTASYADWHGHEHGHGHSYFGFNLSLWPDRYYYERSYYVQPDYVLVSPASYQPVMVNGVTYYVNNGTYYLYTGYGYQAIPSPIAVSQPIVVQQAPQATVVTATPATINTDDSFTINIPNDRGGYTTVVLKRSGNGFVGPQGEFYPEFPKVSQLKVIYGK